MAEVYSALGGPFLFSRKDFVLIKCLIEGGDLTLERAGDRFLESKKRSAEAQGLTQRSAASHAARSLRRKGI